MALSGFIASIVSIIVAFFAIWQAWQFYKQAKNSESQTSIALAEIKAQTETLQKLTGSQIKSLTKAVTDQSPTEKMLLETIATITKGANIQHNIHAPEVGADKGELRVELLRSYIGLHHYAALANNAYTIAYRNAELEPGVANSVLAYVDYSYNDFVHMENILTSFTSSEIQSNSLAHLYSDTENKWKPNVRSLEQLKAAGEIV
jgi:hypothetical protein